MVLRCKIEDCRGDTFCNGVELSLLFITVKVYFQDNSHECRNALKVAQMDFSEGIPPKLECLLRPH